MGIRRAHVFPAVRKLQSAYWGIPVSLPQVFPSEIWAGWEGLEEQKHFVVSAVFRTVLFSAQKPHYYSICLQNQIVNEDSCLISLVAKAAASPFFPISLPCELGGEHSLSNTSFLEISSSQGLTTALPKHKHLSTLLTLSAPWAGSPADRNHWSSASFNKMMLI